MPILTHYIVIYSDPFALQAEQQRTFTFEAPGDLVTDLSSARPLLAFQGKTMAANLNEGTTLVIAVNEHVIRQWETTQKNQCAMWTAFQGRLLCPNSTNTLHFRLLYGAVQLAEVVLWFQRRA